MANKFLQFRNYNKLYHSLKLMHIRIQQPRDTNFKFGIGAVNALPSTASKKISDPFNSSPQHFFNKSLPMVSAGETGAGPVSEPPSTLRNISILHSERIQILVWPFPYTLDNLAKPLNSTVVSAWHDSKQHDLVMHSRFLLLVRRQVYFQT